MARLTLQFPDNAFIYQTDMAVRVTDINMANHLSNDGLISMISEARARFLHAMSVDEMGHTGIGIIVADLATVYQSEAFVREVLRFHVGLHDANRYGGDIVMRIEKAKDGQPVALAKCGFVFFDYTARKVVPMPEDLRARFPG